MTTLQEIFNDRRDNLEDYTDRELLRAIQVTSFFLKDLAKELDKRMEDLERYK